MKRSIILLLVLFPIVAFSQMQHIISQGNTATTKRIVGGNNTIDSNLIKIRSIDKNTLISSPTTYFSFLSSISSIKTPCHELPPSGPCSDMWDFTAKRPGS